MHLQGATMSFDRRFFRPLGVLSIFVSLPILEAGLMSAGAEIRAGDTVRTVLSSLGSFGALLLLLAGIVLCAKRTKGRTIAYWGTAVSVPAHIFGAVIGLMGGHAVLYGVGYPIVIALLLKRATPSSGLPNSTEDFEQQRGTPNEGAHFRSATV
jgi:hypothetical protein